MPALPNAPGVLRLDHFYTIGEDVFAKTRFFHKYTGAPPNNAQLTTMATAVSGDFATDLSPLMNAGYNMTELIITDLTSPTSAIGSSALIQAGTRAGNSLPAEACIVSRRPIGRRFRGGHSRTYFPFGMSQDLHDAQTWTPAFITAANNGLFAYNAHVGLRIAAWGVDGGAVAVSYYSGFTVHTGTTGRARNVSTPRAVALVDPVIGGSVAPGVGSQRRRGLQLA
jgi:hypothetical protein